MMRRRFRRRAAWVWAGQDNLSVTDGAGPAWSVSELLPVGRVSWLLDQQFKRNSLTVQRILLWMQFRWHNLNASAQKAIPDVEFYIRKAQVDAASGATQDWAPYSSPQVPGTVISWSSNESDGMDPFLWTHYIKGETPPNAIVMTATGAALSGGNASSWNQTDTIASQPVDAITPAIVCREFRVSSEWQPNLEIRVKRRLQRDDWLALGMRTTGTNSGVLGELTYRTRILAS